MKRDKQLVTTFIVVAIGFVISVLLPKIFPSNPPNEKPLVAESSASPSSGPIYKTAQVKVVKTKTFHDPETGYYVISEFNILEIKADQSYRCDLTAFDRDGNEIISWKTEGLSFSPRPSTIYSGQTNIKPDQVPTVKSSTVKCEVADAIK